MAFAQIRESTGSPSTESSTLLKYSISFHTSDAKTHFYSYAKNMSSATERTPQNKSARPREREREKKTHNVLNEMRIEKKNKSKTM